MSYPVSSSSSSSCSAAAVTPSVAKRNRAANNAQPGGTNTQRAKVVAREQYKCAIAAGGVQAQGFACSMKPHQWPEQESFLDRIIPIGYIQMSALRKMRKTVHLAITFCVAQHCGAVLSGVHAAGNPGPAGDM